MKYSVFVVFECRDDDDAEMVRNAIGAAVAEYMPQKDYILSSIRKPDVLVTNPPGSGGEGEANWPGS